MSQADAAECSSQHAVQMGNLIAKRLERREGELRK